MRPTAPSISSLNSTPAIYTKKLKTSGRDLTRTVISSRTWTHVVPISDPNKVVKKNSASIHFQLQNEAHSKVLVYLNIWYDSIHHIIIATVNDSRCFLDIALSSRSTFCSKLRSLYYPRKPHCLRLFEKKPSSWHGLCHSYSYYHHSCSPGLTLDGPLP